MASVIKGLTTLVFGCDTVTTVIMQSTDSETSGDVAYVQDEDGDYKAFALFGSGKREVSGEYIYSGADIVTALFTAITLTNAVGSGGLYVYSYSRKASNTGFLRGTYRAAGIDGIS